MRLWYHWTKIPNSTISDIKIIIVIYREREKKNPIAHHAMAFASYLIWQTWRIFNPIIAFYSIFDETFQVVTGEQSRNNNKYPERHMPWNQSHQIHGKSCFDMKWANENQLQNAIKTFIQINFRNMFTGLSSCWNKQNMCITITQKKQIRKNTSCSIIQMYFGTKLNGSNIKINEKRKPGKSTNEQNEIKSIERKSSNEKKRISTCFC